MAAAIETTPTTFAPDYYKQANGISQAELSMTTHTILRRIIKHDRGLNLSPAHWAALHALCMTLTGVAQGKKDGRIVWGLPLGCGKTTVVTAFLIALAELRLEHVGVVVCQNRIGALVELRRELRKYGVDAGLITLLHSDRKCEEPSDSHSPEEARQFTLMTHAAVIDRGRLRSYRDWHGRQRVILWDEALFTQQPTSIDISTLQAQLAGLAMPAIGNPDLQEALEYLNANAQIAYQTAVKLKETEEQTGSAVFVPCHDREKLERMRRGLSRISRSTEAAEVLLHISQLAGAKVRTVQMGGGVISFKESIPRDLTSIIVLDASEAVRTILENDTTLKSAEDVSVVKTVKQQHGLESLASLKTYDDVKVVQILAPGGRYSVVGTKRSPKGDLKRAEPVLLKLIADYVVKGYDDGLAGVLVYHFKARDGHPNARSMLKVELERRRPGITTKLTDPKRVDETTEGQQPWWLKFEHNGDEEGFNHARHCELVILWGVLHDPDHVITSKMIATCDDLDTDLSHDRVQGYMNSEKHHRVLQAGGRGTMRNPGKEPSSAAPMTLVVVDPDETLGPALKAVCPGIDWRYRAGPKGYSPERGIPFLAKLALVEFLKAQPKDVEKVSTKEAKAAVVAELGEPLSRGKWLRARNEGAALTGWAAAGTWITRQVHNPKKDSMGLST